MEPGMNSRVTACVGIFALSSLAAPSGELELLGGIDGTKGVTSQYSMTITGRVRNNRPKAYKYAQITFTVYNKAGDQIGSALANISGLEPGATWAFKAVCLSAGGSSYKLAEITGW